MKPDFALGQYYPVASLLHRIDSRIKLVSVLMFSVALLFIQNFLGLALCLLAVSITFLIARIPFVFIIRGMQTVGVLMVLTIILQAFSSGGPSIVVGPLAISKPGFIQGIFVSFRLLILLTGASLLTLTSTPVELTDGIDKLLSPLGRLRLPVHELAMMMGIALRFVPTISAEANSIIRAQMARGARFDSGGFMIRIRSYIPVIIPLFVSVFRRADELAEAMDSRGYRVGIGRTRLRQLKLQKHDVTAAIIVVTVIAMCVWVGRLPVM